LGVKLGGVVLYEELHQHEHGNEHMALVADKKAE
jgi:hypothetical protein